MEPLVVYVPQFSRLLQTSELVVNHVNERLIITYDSQLTGRNVYRVKHQTVNTQLRHLKPQRYLTPYKIIILPITHSRQSVLG